MRKSALYLFIVGVLCFSALACMASGQYEPTPEPTRTDDPSLPVGSSVTDTPEATETGALTEPVDIPGATLVYYDISGSTESELRAQLDALAPLGFDNYKGDATTKWFINWNWPGYGTDTCDLGSATVSYEMQVILPRWSPPENADPELVAKWTAYSQALVEHEKGHADFVVANYLSVADAIRAATCQTAEQAAQTALKAIRQHDIDYDAETSHGAAQGARFP